MSQIITINYCCQTCGHTWDDCFSIDAMEGICQCPNCEESVHGSVS